MPHPFHGLLDQLSPTRDDGFRQDWQKITKKKKKRHAEGFDEGRFDAALAILSMDTRGAGVIASSSAYQNLQTVWLSRASEVNQRNFWIFPIFKFENRLRTTCPRFLPSFALPDKAVQFQQT